MNIMVVPATGTCEYNSNTFVGSSYSLTCAGQPIFRLKGTSIFMSRSADYPASDRKQFWIGFLLAGVGAILFSAKAIVAKLTYRYGVDALTVLGFRMLLSLPFFAFIALLQLHNARRGNIVRLTRVEGFQVVFLGFIGYYLASYLDFLGLQYISASLERLILFLAPTFVLLLSALLLKKPISGRQWIALVLSYIGVVFVFVQDLSFGGGNVPLGSAFVLGSALSYALYLIGSGELLKRIGATRLVAYAMTVSCVVSIAHFFAVYSWAGLQQHAAVIHLSLLHAVLHTVLPTFMIMWSVARIGAPMASQLGLLGPVSLLFLAAWLLDEPITVLQLVGTGITLTGALVLTLRQGRPRAQQPQITKAPSS